MYDSFNVVFLENSIKQQAISHIALNEEWATAADALDSIQNLNFAVAEVVQNDCLLPLPPVIKTVTCLTPRSLGEKAEECRAHSRLQIARYRLHRHTLRFALQSSRKGRYQGLSGGVYGLRV